MISLGSSSAISESKAPQNINLDKLDFNLEEGNKEEEDAKEEEKAQSPDADEESEEQSAEEQEEQKDSQAQEEEK